MRAAGGGRRRGGGGGCERRRRARPVVPLAARAAPFAINALLNLSVEFHNQRWLARRLPSLVQLMMEKKCTRRADWVALTRCSRICRPIRGTVRKCTGGLVLRTMQFNKESVKLPPIAAAADADGGDGEDGGGGEGASPAFGRSLLGQRRPSAAAVMRRRSRRRRRPQRRPMSSKRTEWLDGLFDDDTTTPPPPTRCSLRRRTSIDAAAAELRKVKLRDEMDARLHAGGSASRRRRTSHLGRRRTGSGAGRRRRRRQPRGHQAKEEKAVARVPLPQLMCRPLATLGVISCRAAERARRAEAGRPPPRAAGQQRQQMRRGRPAPARPQSRLDGPGARRGGVNKGDVTATMIRGRRP